MNKLPPGTKNVSYLLNTGIYFLYFDETLQWIGSSLCLVDRLAQHYRGESTTRDGGLSKIAIEFNRVFILPCDPEGKDVMEKALIQRLKPKYNYKNTVGDDYTFTDGPLKGMTIEAKRPDQFDYKWGTSVDEYLEELEKKF